MTDAELKFAAMAILFVLATVGVHSDWWPFLIGAMQGLLFLMMAMAYARV